MKNFLKTYWIPFVLILIGLCFIAFGVIGFMSKTKTGIGRSEISHGISRGDVKLKPNTLHKAPAPTVRQRNTPVILKVTKTDYGYMIKFNKKAVRGDTIARVYVGYCSYDGVIGADGIARVPIDWSPPGGKVKAGAWQVDDSHDFGGGKLICSVEI